VPARWDPVAQAPGLDAQGVQVPGACCGWTPACLGYPPGLSTRLAGWIPMVHQRTPNRLSVP